VSPPSELTAEPLTADEERQLREDIGFFVGSWYHTTVERLLATLDAARAAPQADAGTLREALIVFLDDLYAPDHVEGCLWLADKRMPCQCGSADRKNDLRRRGRGLRAALAASSPAEPSDADAD